MPLRIELVDCRNSNMNGLRGLVIGHTEGTIRLLTETGRVLIIPVKSCRYYVWLNNCVMLMTPRGLRKLIRRINAQ
ncbi:ribonuclease P protein subunit [Caldivirga sp. UBA161]|uniref:ribonuclease P protein subunit n=1 Tax=Caldivirga sp. UBA161 TaxID=1915569 RepID=UPI0025C4E94F|nr:ribonuclease P protein subunit [Caldivirga sp. UBA161]